MFIYVVLFLGTMQQFSIELGSRRVDSSRRSLLASVVVVFAVIDACFVYKVGDCSRLLNLYYVEPSSNIAVNIIKSNYSVETLEGTAQSTNFVFS